MINPVPSFPTAALLGLALLGAVPVRVAAQPRPDSLPTLVIHITVDQMRGDYLRRFGPQFTGGLQRFAQGGAVFTRGYQDHAMTETAPGHATTLSGRNPVATGIIRNSEGVNDPGAPLLEVSGPGASPLRFRGTALFDWMQARWPAARAFSVSRKDRGAILPVGRAIQSVFWYEGGQFTTSRYYADTLPSWVRSFNAAAKAARAPGTPWDLLLPPVQYPEPDSMPYENRGQTFVFPYALPADSVAAWRAFISTPMMDSLTLTFALQGVREMGLGVGPHPDLLAISLSACDYVGHAWGPNSRELHDQQLRMDRYLGAFLDSLAVLRDMRRVVISFTSDHGVTPYPEWSRTHGRPRAGYVELDSIVRRYRQELEVARGLGRALRWFDLGLLVADRRGLDSAGLNADSVFRGMTRAFRRVPGVARVDNWPSLLAADTARDAIARRWRNLAPRDYGAELFVMLLPGMYFDSVGYAMHGQPTEDDAHVPVVFYGPMIRRGTYPRRVSVVDIAPTLAVILGIEPLEPLQGRALREALR